MTGRLPKKFYYVLLEYGEGQKVRFTAKGGGKYTDERHALAQWESLTRRGVRCKLFVSSPVVWCEITPGEETLDEVSTGI